jgi:cytochrome c-type biogenesis protein CcmF
LQIGGERLRFDGVQQFRHDNYLTVQARLTSLNGSYTLTPERRRYPVQEAPTTEAGIHSTLLRDVYAVITEPDSGRWGVQVYVNPLVQFIWLGGMVIISGLGITLGYRVRRMIRSPATAPASLS